MFERFTEDAREVVVGAREHAVRLGHRQVGTEHLLLSLLDHSPAAADLLKASGVTAAVVEAGIVKYLAGHGGGPSPEPLGEQDAEALKAIGIDLDAVRARIEDNLGPVDLVPPPPPEPRGWLFGRKPRPTAHAPGHLPFTPRAKKVLELALREALNLRNKEIRAGHLVLGIIREGEGLAAWVLVDAGVDLSALRTRVAASLRPAA